jgi:hypothetical protein
LAGKDLQYPDYRTGLASLAKSDNFKQIEAVAPSTGLTLLDNGQEFESGKNREAVDTAGLEARVTALEEIVSMLKNKIIAMETIQQQ